MPLFYLFTHKHKLKHYPFPHPALVPPSHAKAIETQLTRQNMTFPIGQL